MQNSEFPVLNPNWLALKIQLNLALISKELYTRILFCLFNMDILIHLQSTPSSHWNSFEPKLLQILKENHEF